MLDMFNVKLSLERYWIFLKVCTYVCLHVRTLMMTVTAVET
jgi:hypothetical protein